MDLKLTGKRAIVTGSSGGIGESIALSLASEGATVIIHGRRAEQAKKVAELVGKSGGKAFIALGDLSTDRGAQEVFEAAQKAVGDIDILVNCAGVYVDRSWSVATPDNWSEMYNGNVLSCVRMIRLIVPRMKELGWGRIIQIATGEATQPFADMPDYAASKSALLNLTVSLSKELAGKGITVNSISPGIVLTPGLETFFRSFAQEKGWGTDWNEIEQHILRERWYSPAGRLARPQDIASAVTFLSSPVADYINAANLRVDGGAVGTVN